MTWKTRPRSERSGLAWIEQGAGPSVLLLHGVGLRAEAWNAQADALTEAGFHVLAPDMLGHGSSSAPPAPAAPGMRSVASRPVMAGPSVTPRRTSVLETIPSLTQGDSLLVRAPTP